MRASGNRFMKYIEWGWGSVCEARSHTKVVPCQAMAHIEHTLIRTLLPAHLSFLSTIEWPRQHPAQPSTLHSLTAIPIIICDECNFMCVFSFDVALCKETASATPIAHNETQSRQQKHNHKCAQKTNTRSKRTNIDIFNINFY